MIELTSVVTQWCMLTFFTSEQRKVDIHPQVGAQVNSYFGQINVTHATS